MVGSGEGDIFPDVAPDRRMSCRRTNHGTINQGRTMKWRFDDILTFMSVVEAGSVTSAATRLNISKSVISKRISDLEAALRVELFHRSI